MSELDNRVSIQVQITDTSATRPGFGVEAIVHDHGRDDLGKVQTYFSLEGLKEDFPNYTPVGKFGEIFFSQEFKSESVKVIRREAGQAIDQALDEALFIDSGFYGVGVPGDVQADQEKAGAWALSNGRLAFYCSEDPTIPTDSASDVASHFKGLDNNRVAGWYNQKAGVEFTIDSITVSGTTATVDHTTFGELPVEIGDPIGIWTSANPDLNSTWEVATKTATNFTVEVPNGTTSDLVAGIRAWTNFNRIDSAIAGKMLPKDAGSSTWDLQKLSAVSASGGADGWMPKLTGTEQSFLGSKNINWFSTVAGLNITGGLKSNGGGGKLASGRYIDVQRGADWLESNLQIDLFELIVDSGGELGFTADDLQKVETKIALRLNDGLNKGFLTPFVSGQFAGQPYNIKMPNLADIPQADKTKRLLEGIEINALIKGKIHNLEATLTLST